MRPASPTDEKETTLGVLIVAVGTGIMASMFEGSIGFLIGFVGGIVAASGLVLILRGEY